MVLPLCSALVRYIWDTVSSAGFLSTREAWTYWAKVHRDNEETGASDTRGEAERAGIVPSGEEQARRELTSVYRYLMGEKLDPGSSQRCSVKLTTPVAASNTKSLPLVSCFLPRKPQHNSTLTVHISSQDHDLCLRPLTAQRGITTTYTETAPLQRTCGQRHRKKQTDQSINTWLRGWCHCHNSGFFNNGMVYRAPGLLASNGIHLSQSGERVFAHELAGLIDRALN
ncbi:hypothetical protein QYF61_005730 [Mycteria americana]|uniref:Uncharacterized protein n=1 Tax=Mycteria americana TaxID=33587 RepID=A0AAN7S2M3_MYCAM|nr:hypothetical protein QYF61_005730 [Mycteria americana]